MSPRDPLDDLLDRWQAPSDPPDLRACVRHELSALRSRSAQDTTTWFDRIEAAFARPSFVVTFITACVLLGLFLAEARVSRLHAEYGVQIARSYVQLIDPLIDANGHARAPGKGKL